MKKFLFNKDIIIMFAIIIAVLFVGYEDYFSPRSKECASLGGKYDILPGGYGECSIVTVTHIDLDKAS